MIILLSVPEGLPMCLTLSLAIAVHFLKEKNIVV
jgi:magnesium-transporting ATPase (P-type)